MRSFAFLLLGLLLAAPNPLVAQAKAAPDGDAVLKELRALNFVLADLDKLDAIVEKYRPTIREAQAQVDVLKAQLTKALVPAKPDRAELRRLVDESVVVEGRLRFAQIERQIELREFLGEKRWKAFNKAFRGYRELVKKEPAAATVTEPALVRTVGLFDDLVP